MRILLIHNFYREFGGEDAVALAEKRLLEDYGHEVYLYARHNNEIAKYNLLDKLAFLFRTVYSRRTARDIADIVSAWKPDVAYIHNVFPLISPSVYHSLWSLKVPSVQVLNDFRPFCPNGYFFTQNHVCERCKNGNYFHAVRYRCHRNSYIASALYSGALWMNRLAGMLRRIDAFVCLTEFSRQKLSEARIPPERIFLKPNFTPTPPLCSAHPTKAGGYVLYLGRVSAEKGLWTLVHAFECLPFLELKIVGTGPLEAALKAYLHLKAIKNVTMVGFREGGEKWELLRNSLFTVVPSVWYETFGLVVVEAYAAGKAVIGSRLGSLPFVIEENKSGILFEPGSVKDLVNKVRYFLDRPGEAERMGKYARSLVESTYSSSVCYHRLMSIFSSVMPTSLDG